MNRRAAYVRAVATTAFVVAALAAPATPAAATGAGLPVQLWGIEVDRGSVGLLTPERLRQLRRSGTNALIADPSRLSARQLSRVGAAAKRWRLTLVTPIVTVGAATNGPEEAAAACRALKQRRASPCVVAAPSLALAQASAAHEDIDLVVVRLGSPAEVRRVGDSLASSTPAARLVVLPRLRGTTRAWRTAITAVERNLAVDIAVAPSGARKDAMLRRYLNVLRSTRVASATKRVYRGPGRPARVSVIGASGRSVALRWSKTAGKTRTVAFVLFRGTAAVGATRTSSATFYGLRCGTTNLLGVAAVDRRGNRSRGFYVSTPTAACTTAEASPVPTPGGGPGGPSGGSGGSGTGTTPTPSGHGPTKPAPPGPPPPPPSGGPSPPGSPPPPAGPPGTLTRASVATWGSDSNPCTQALPCSSFGRAYRAAAPGAVVEISGGSYSAQEIDDDPDKGGGGPVTFQPAPGATVFVDVLDFGQAQFSRTGPKNVSIRDVQTRIIRSWPGSANLVWQNIDARIFGVFDSTNVSIVGGDYGPCQAPRDGNCVSLVAGTSSNVTIDGVYIHDISSTDLTNYHVVGLFIRGGNNVTIRRSKFRRNMITNIRFQNQPCCSNQTILVENNWFAAPLQGDGVSPRSDAIDVDDPVSNLLIRNNSFAQNAGPLVLAGSARIVGNLMQNLGCVGGVTYAYNLFIPFSQWNGQTACGPTDKKVTMFGYTDPAGFDYHLAAGSPALGAGAPGDCPTTDIDGQSRSSPCDAGSDER